MPPNLPNFLAACLTLALAFTHSHSSDGKPAIGSFTDARDGKNYKTVKIGEQTWMAENLDYYVSGSRCYDNKSTNCAIYGRLYNWETAMAVCPEDWHLPSKTEWEKLILAVGKIDLKAKNGWKDYGSTSGSKNGNGEDTYGFSALPGGYHSSGFPTYCNWSNGEFYNVGYLGNWWSSSEYLFDEAYNSTMLNHSISVYLDRYCKSSLYSVRCIKD
jgi:uncharacterized protein (TIGR02145 family)